jgi:hypothetical protein
MNSDIQPTTPLSQSHESPPQTSPPTATPDENDVPPDGGYGWVCVASTFWINAHTWGINSVRISIPMSFASIVIIVSCLIAISSTNYDCPKSLSAYFLHTTLAMIYSPARVALNMHLSGASACHAHC